MGILVDFMIKHVRPHGMEAWTTITARGPGSLHAWLVSVGVPPGSIDAAFNAWAQTANRAIDTHSLPQFVQSAQMISLARWDQLYATDRSTILFLNEPLLKELSFESEQNAGRTFQFRPQEYIPLAVTINRSGSPAQIDLNVSGATLAADQNGFCNHFAALIL